MEFPSSKFNIGDWVYFRQDIENWKQLSEEDRKWDKRRMNKRLITYIRADTCPGGTQISYGFRGYTTVAQIQEWILEMELTDKLE